MEKYDSCVFSSLGNCGDHSASRKSGMFAYSDLQNSVIDDLNKCTRLEDNVDLVEYQLIQSRSNKTLSASDEICAHHRYKFGLFWRPPKRCQHPLHKQDNFQKTKKSIGVRSASWAIYLKIREKYGNIFPIGGVLCTTHRNLEEKEAELAQNFDADYVVPEASVLSPEEKQKSRAVLDDLTSCVAPDASPVKFLITSPVQHLSEHTIRYAKRKYTQAKQAMKKKFCEYLAPTQGDELASRLSSGTDETSSDNETVPGELKQLYDAYVNCTNEKTRMAILSSIDPKLYCKKKVMKVFDCTKYKIDTARKWRNNFGVCGEPEQKTNTKQKLNMDKVQHFLDFLFQSGALHDVAYGTNTLTFQSGEKIIVPKTVLTALRSHTISEYLVYCKEVNYTPLHVSSLWKILRVIKPSHRHSLAGLDNTVAAGLEAFEVLGSLIKELVNGSRKQDLMKQLEMCKRYLKITYSTHCDENSDCASHCSTHSLSIPSEKQFQSVCVVSHTRQCKQCNTLLRMLGEILELIGEYNEDSEKKADLYYDFQKNQQNILEWMRHVMRDSQQNKAKVDAVALINDTCGFWIRDWSQKVMPVKYRESQRDYFGKKGMSLHIDVFFHRTEGKLIKSVYFTCLFRSEQDMLDTLSVGETVIKQYHSDYPNITSCYCKCDNAGCYSANGYAECLHMLCKKADIQLKRLDYNEPQRGKDQADRESAVAKRYMAAYVNSGHDMITAEDMKKGILYMGGPKDAKVAVVDINHDEVSMENTPKIPGISTIHSVLFEENAMTLWQYYRIGNGKTVPYSGLKFNSRTTIKDGFSSEENFNKSNSSGKKTDRCYQQLHFCSEENCSQTFTDSVQLQEHITRGFHTKFVTKGSADQIRKAYGLSLKASANTTSFSTVTPAVQNSIVDIPEEGFFKEGWALYEKKRTRISYKQKKFLFDTFIKGEQTNCKIGPEKVVNEMRTARNSLGLKVFKPAEYLTTSQVQSQFSRMSLLKRQGQLQEPSMLKTDEEHQEITYKDTTEIEEQMEIDILMQDIAEMYSDETFAVNDYVYIRSGSQKGRKHYVGRVCSIEENTFTISFMRNKGDYFVWGEQDESPIDRSYVHLKLHPPDVDRRERYTFREDFDRMSQCCLHD